MVRTYVVERYYNQNMEPSQPAKARLQELQGRDTHFQVSVPIVFRKIVIRPTMASNPVDAFPL